MFDTEFKSILDDKTRKIKDFEEIHFLSINSI